MTRPRPRPNSGPVLGLRARRRTLLAGVALAGALLAAASPQAARAQAFQANPTDTGGVTYTRTPNSDVITVATPTAIITWTPFNPVPGVTYVFLPAGNVATFQNEVGGGDFTVLNRILLFDEPARFDGTVISQLQIGSGLTSPGGTLLFSSPGGIIVGSTAVFDVGNLVLTSLDVVESSPGNFITPAGGFQLVRTSAAPDSAVIVDAGASITATPENSYVALVAPRVVQGGNISVNGSTALIGADAVEFSVNQGLFDIVVTTGSDNPVPVTHTGSTGGPASGGGGDGHNIYAVVVGRNQAVRMLLQGSLGYTPATDASVDNGGAIVLSAGYDITGGNIGAPAPGTVADIELADGTFTSNVVGRATGAIVATATTADPLDFTGSLSLEAVGAVSLVAGLGASVTVGTGATLIGDTVDVDSIIVGGGLSASSTGATAIDNADAASILVTAGGAADLGILTADFNIDVDAASIALDSGTAGSDLTLSTPGDATVLFAQAGDDFTATVGGAFSGGTIVTTGLAFDGESDDPGAPLLGSNIILDVTGAVDAGTLDAFDNIVVDPTSITIAVAIAGADIILDATGDITVGSADAGDDFIATAGTTFTGGTVIARGIKDNDSSGPFVGGNIDVTAGTDLRLDNGDAANAIRLASTDGSILSDGLLDAGTDLDADAAVDIRVTDADAAGDVSLDAGADILLASSQAGDDFVATAGGAFSAGTVTATGLGPDSESGLGALAGGSIQVTAAADLRLDDGDAAAAILLTSTAGNVLGDGLLTAGGLIDVDAAFVIGIADADAGTTIDLAAGGDVNAADLTAGGAISSSSGGSTAIAGAASGASITIDSVGDIRLDDGNAVGAIDLTSATGNIFSNTLLAAGTFIDADAALDVDITDADAGTTIDLAAGVNVDAEDMTAGGTISTTSGGDTNIATATSGGSILIDAAGAVTAGTLNAFDDIIVDPTSISILVAIAGADIILDATGDITVGSADAGDDFIATAGTTFTGGTVIARGLRDNDSIGSLVGGNIDVTAGSDLRLDNGDAADAIRLTSTAGSILSSTLLDAGTDLDADAAADILVADANAAGDVSLDAGAEITLASSQAGDDFVANAGGAFTAGTVVATGLGFDSEDGVGPLAGGNIQVTAAGDLRLDNGDAANAIRLTSTGGAILSSTLLDAGTDLDADAAGAILVAGADAGGDVSLDAGTDIVLASSQAGDDFVATAGGTFTAGTVTVGTGADSEGGLGTLAGGNILVAAVGDLRLDDGTAPNRIELTSTGGSILSGGTLSADRLVANAAFDLRLNDVFVVSGLDLATVNGDITGNSFNSDGDIVLDASDEVVLNQATSGGDISITAGNNLRLNNGTAPGLIGLSSAGGSIFSAGTLDANQLLADAAFDLVLNDVFVVADLVLLAPGGSISGNRFTSDGLILLDAFGAVTLASADSGGSILVTGGGDVRLDRGRADEAIQLTSTGGSIFSDPLGGGGGGDGGLPPTDGLLDAGTDVILTAALDVTIDDASAGNLIVIDAGRDVAVRNLDAVQSIDVDAAGSAAFTGAARAPTITVASADIDIAAAASLGDGATQLVSLTALGNGQQTILGGTADGSGYTLTDAEADRITAATLRISAPPAGTAADRPADILVRDLSLAGAQVGLFDLRTTGIVQVEGGLLLAGVRPGGGIEIRATERIQIVNPSGSIRVRDGAGLTDGNLLLFSDNIWSASQSLLDQLRADPDFAGRDEALLANNGPVEPRGYIEAGDVVLSAGDTLFVQNSGSLLAFAGITVRESTLRIVPTGNLPLRVFAFGRRINPDGSFVTNSAFFNEVEYQGRGGPVGYADDAQFNLCFINTGICRLPTGNPVPGGPDIIEQPVDPGLTITLPLGGDDLVDTSFADEPLIEEPVTSGSDSILWDCDRDDDGDCDEDDNDG